MEPYCARGIEDRKLHVVKSLNFNSILEVGCGNGGYLPYLKKRAKFVVGIDINRSLAKRSHLRGFDIILASMDRLPFKDRSFECVWISEVLEHMPSFDPLNEIERVITKKIVLTIPNPVFPHFKRDPSHVLRYSVSSFKNVLFQRSKRSSWSYIVRGMGYNENIPTRLIRKLSLYLTWFFPHLSPTILAVGANKGARVSNGKKLIHVFAYSILESGTMAGGYKNAIELVRRWSLLENAEFLIHTTSEGQRMFGRHIPTKRNIAYDISWTPSLLMKVSLRHALISVVLYAFLSYSCSAKAILSPKKNSPQLVYSVTPFLPDTIPGLLTKFKTKKTKWFVAHSMFAPSLLGGGFGIPGHRKIPSLRDLGFYMNEKLTYAVLKKYSDLIGETNELDRERCIKDGFHPSSVIVLSGGADIKLVKEIREPLEKEFDAVFVGRLHPQKGLFELINIWACVCRKKTDAKLAIIGNGPLENDIKRRVKKSGLEQNVFFFGFVDGIEKIKIFKNSRIVVHPSVYDSGGMAACEAMACGLPGVSFDLPALRTYYPFGMLKSTCFDLEAFASNILALLENKDLFEKTRKEAIESASEWDWDKKMDEYLDIIRSKFHEISPDEGCDEKR